MNPIVIITPFFEQQSIFDAKISYIICLNICRFFRFAISDKFNTCIKSAVVYITDDRVFLLQILKTVKKYSPDLFTCFMKPFEVSLSIT